MQDIPITKKNKESGVAGLGIDLNNAFSVSVHLFLVILWGFAYQCDSLYSWATYGTLPLLPLKSAIINCASLCGTLKHSAQKTVFYYVKFLSGDLSPPPLPRMSHEVGLGGS